MREDFWEHFVNLRMLMADIGRFRISQRFRVDGDIFENAPRVDADLFLIRIKKDAFSKISGYVWTWPEGLVKKIKSNQSNQIK